MTVIELQQALERAPAGAARVAALKSLALALEQEQRLAEAARCLVEAQRLAPEDLGVVQAGRRVFVAARQWPGALKWLQLEISLSPTPTERAQAFSRLGTIYQNELRDLEAAQNAFGQARVLDHRAMGTELVEPPPAPPGGAATAPAEPPPPSATSGSGTWSTSSPSSAGRAPPPGAGPSPEPLLRDGRPDQPPPPRAPRPTLAQTVARLRGGDWRGWGVGLGALAVLTWVGFIVLWPEPPPLVTCPAGALVVEARRGELHDVWCERAGSRIGPFVTERDGVILSNVTWQFGKRNGPALETEEGLVGEGAYKDDLRTGEWLFRAAGTLRRRDSYRAGLLSGSALRYWPDGGLAEHQDYDGGLRWGRFVRFRENGSTEQEGEYLAGQPSGSWSRFSAINVLEEMWEEPRQPAAQAEPAEATSLPDGGPVEPLYAGRSASWWRDRVALLKAAGEPSRALLELTLHRAALQGVPLASPP